MTRLLGLNTWMDIATSQFSRASNSISLYRNPVDEIVAIYTGKATEINRFKIKVVTD